MSSKDVVEDFCSSLCDLTVNSKPHINMLTMLAEDYIDHAPAIVKAVEEQLKHVSGDVKLPVLYLIDSIIKNVGESYIPLFCQNIVSTFSHAFERVDENARSQMYKLRQTWTGIFPAGKLFALDTTVNGVDPAWPITATTSSIHLNPKFLNNPPNAALALPISTGKNQQELLKQKKELLELQKRKVELELLQTKAILEGQTKWSGTTTGPRDVAKIPPATNIITKPKTPVEALKPKSNAVAAIASPVRIRDPRLRMKETVKEPSQPPSAVKSPPRTVLSSVQSPTNKSASENIVKSPKKDKKTKKSKEERSSKNKNDNRRSPSKLKESKSDKNKMTRAEEVLRNLEEEQRLSKIQKLGSDTVINKAKQHEQKLHPKTKETAKAASTESKIAIYAKEPVPAEAPPVVKPLSPPRPPSPKISVPIKEHKPADTNNVPLDTQSQSVPDPMPPPPPSLITASQLQPSVVPPINETASLPDITGKHDALVENGSKSDIPSPPKTSKNKVKSGPKRKRESSPTQSPRQKTPPISIVDKELVKPSLFPEPEILLDSSQDIDFRLLTSKTMDLEGSPAKKARTDSLDELFGKEDVDLRAIPPPAPIISRPTPPTSPSLMLRPSPERQKSWANLKRSNSEVSPESSKRPYKTPHDRRKSDRFNVNQDKEVVDEELGFDDPGYDERAKERVEMMMKHAEEQLSNGNITFAQYNGLLKEVITMNEMRKLKEAMRRDKDAEESGFDPEVEEPASPEPTTVYNKRRKFADNVEPLVDDAFDDPPLPPPPPDLNDRDFMSRDDHRKDDRERRYRDRDRPPRFEPGRNHQPSAGPWQVGQPSSVMPRGGGSRARDKFGRWGPATGPNRIFDTGKPNFRFRPPPINNFAGGVAPPNREVPPADPAVLELIAKDTMKTINIDGVPREIRFYGETAVIMMSWDDPRELNFQPGQRRVTFNDRETVVLQFNSPYREMYVDGIPCKVRLGAPTREIFIDGMFYECIFGGPPLQVRIGNRMHSVRISGPLPNVRIGSESRKDLVAGKVTLIVDANDIFPVYLDAKPQRFVIGGVQYILRFVEALQTAVINGVPFKIEFGSNLPVPMFFHGEKHYLRFSALPKDVKPGYVNIVNMEGGRLPSPPPPVLVPPPIIGHSDQSGLLPPAHSHSDVILSEPAQQPVDSVPPIDNLVSRPQSEQQSLELLASLMPTVFTPGIGQSYTVEENSNHPTDVSTESTTASVSTATDTGSINVGELLKKLVAVGMVPAAEKKEEKRVEVSTEIVPVCFDRPESLKTRQPGLVHSLYFGMQCSSCGVRFPPEQTGKYSQHLDWHFRQNRRERDAMRIAQSRRWNYDVSDWIQFQEIEEKEDRAQSWFEIQEKRNFESEEAADDEPSVPAGEKGENTCCEICHDRFDQFYNEEKEEWHLRRAVEVDGKLYHPLCHQDRENKLSSSLAAANVTTELDKSVLLVPTEEPETIEIPDDTVVGEEAVLGMPVDDPDKVETIDLDSEQSSSKDGLSEEIPKKEEEPVEESDDDDILHIEVLENKIETFELSDEEDKDDDEPKSSAPSSPKNSNEIVTEDVEVASEDLEIDLSKVKTEKLEVVDLDAQQTSQPLVVSSIDGNVELEDAAPVSLPKRIKINIPSAISKVPKPTVVETTVDSTEEDEDSAEVETLPIPASSEPPPPGEELYPSTVKPKLTDVDLKILPPVNKGNELSALCSIM